MQGRPLSIHERLAQLETDLGSAMVALGQWKSATGCQTPEEAAKVRDEQVTARERVIGLGSAMQANGTALAEVRAWHTKACAELGLARAAVEAARPMASMAIFAGDRDLAEALHIPLLAKAITTYDDAASRAAAHDFAALLTRDKP